MENTNNTEKVIGTEDSKLELTQYLGVKLVFATPMTRGEFNKLKNVEIPEDDASYNDEGYFVKYADDYESWCPKDSFESAYRVVGTDLLFDTAFLMCSADYRDRFKAEYYQLFSRFTKLKAMVDKWDSGNLEFKPTCPRSLFSLQLRAMGDYLSVLEARALIDGITL